MNSKIHSDVITNAIYQRYLAALLAGERAECAGVVQELVAAGADLKDLYVHLFQRALYQVGELWEQQRISVAVEHLATAITERMLTLVQTQTFGGGARKHSIIIACVADEYHQLGGRMIADFCEFSGWRGYFLGADTPLPGLLRLIAERRPTLLGLSLSIYFNLPALLKALAAVGSAYPELPILVGGQAFRWGGLSALLDFPNVTHIATLGELEQQLLIHEL
jgi:methanogenic corrinoid protein MtbC1